MRSLKSSAAKIHLWMGLTVGLVGVYMAATGGWILFRPQADALVNASYLTTPAPCAKPVSLNRILGAATRAYPKAAVDALSWQNDPRATLMVRYRDDQQSYFNPCDGALIGFHSRWSGTFGFVEKLHRFRFLPSWFAEKMAGTFAIVMAVLMGGLGLYLWWPRRRSAWKVSLTLDRALKGRARTRNRHSVVGAVAAAGLILIAGTGVALAFESVENLIFTATGTARIAKPHVDRPTEGQPVALEAAWRNALRLMKDPPRAASLRLPTGERNSIEMYVYDRGNANLEGRTYVYADPATGRILKYVPYAQTPLGQRAYSWMVALHEGEVGGLAGQLLTFATMLAIFYLGYSGTRSYLQKRYPADAPVRMRVAAIREQADRIKEFDLVPVRPGRLRGFSAGSHIEIQLANGTKRQYSLCNGPEQRASYTVAVRLEELSRGGSRAMHELTVGDEVGVAGPRNHFALDRSNRHAVLIAAGIGVTPILSMALHLRSREIPFELHYFGKDADAMAYRDFLLSCDFATNVHIHEGLERSKIRSTLENILERQPDGSHAYTCGPDGFMTQVEGLAITAGWPARTIHRENFVPVASGMEGPREEVEVTLARSGRKVIVPAEQTILAALTGAGLPVPSSCEQGTCGECAIAVCGGQIDHRDCFLSDAQRKRGDVILCCVSRAKDGALVLDI